MQIIYKYNKIYYEAADIIIIYIIILLIPVSYLLSTRPPRERPDALAHRRLQMARVLRSHVHFHRLAYAPHLTARVAHLREWNWQLFNTNN